MKYAFVLLLALGFSTRAVQAAPVTQTSVALETAAETEIPQLPTGAELAKIVGLPPSVSYTVTKAKTSSLFEDSKPLQVAFYSAEKQTPFSYSIEIFPAGSLFGKRRREQELQIEKFTNEQRKRWEEQKIDSLLNQGYVLEERRNENEFISIETRPDGRKVYFTGFAVGPGGGILGAFTKVGQYDVLLVQYAFGGDGDDPEETERVRRMAIPSRSLPTAFAQLEKAMSIFPLVAESPSPKPALVQPAEAEPAGKSSTASAPRRPTAAEFARCLDLLKPVQFHSYGESRSPIFVQFKPVWVSLYSTNSLDFSGYSVEIYPARTLFGNRRRWLEQWLEARDLQTKKSAQLTGKNLKKVGAKSALAPSAAVVVRPDGRKVYFRRFTMASGAPAPTVFSTIGNYDVVLTQFSYSSDAQEQVARKKVAPRLGMLQAFAKLEAVLAKPK
jgi:hypothetical protein